MYEHHPKFAAPDVVGQLTDALGALAVVPRRFSAKAQFICPILKRQIETCLEQARELAAEVEATADWDTPGGITIDEARDAEAKFREQS
jgi:hypothetical protein